MSMATMVVLQTGERSLRLRLRPRRRNEVYRSDIQRIHSSPEAGLNTAA